MIRGVQGAVALRRQRSRRDDYHRRMTNASIEGINAVHHAAHLHRQDGSHPSGHHPKSRSSVFGTTFFHIGLVMLFIGFMMVITATIPGYISEDNTFDLVGTGTFFVLVGGVMTMINRAITKKEDNRLERYVSDRLARSKSGCLLVRDEESGGFNPIVHRRSRRPSRSPRPSTHGEHIGSPSPVASGTGSAGDGVSSSQGFQVSPREAGPHSDKLHSSLSEIPEETSTTSGNQPVTTVQSAVSVHHHGESTPSTPQHKPSAHSTPTKSRHTRASGSQSGHSGTSNSPVATHRARVTHLEHVPHVSHVTQLAGSEHDQQRARGQPHNL